MDDIKKEQMAKEAEEYIDKFKVRFKSLVEEILGDVYVDLLPHIETDSWQNFRNVVRENVVGDFVKKDFRYSYESDLRRKIFKENKAEMIELIDQDLRERVKVLEDRLNFAERERYF